MPRVKVKARQTARFRAWAIAVVLTAAACGPRAPSPESAGPRERPPTSRVPDRPPPAFPARPPTAQAGCEAQGFAEAARANGASLNALAWAPFRRPEIGWAVYAPLVGREIGSPCPPQSRAFAAALAAWQQRQGLGGGGRLDERTFQAMKAAWQARRPFVRLRGACPPPPEVTRLAAAEPAEGYSGKAIALRPAALDAYRRMAAAARAEVPAIRADPRNLTIFSGFRAPEADALRCAREGNCDGIARAVCSPHRTGLAMDLYVGQAPGFPPDSSADPNRLFQTQTPTYRWLLANAQRFGFANYPFEPWHWEWTGERP